MGQDGALFDARRTSSSCSKDAGAGAVQELRPQRSATHLEEARVGRGHERRSRASRRAVHELPESPRLTPNTGQAFNAVSDGVTTALRNGFGQNALASQAGFLKAYPRVSATATATISGSVANNDVLNLVITSPLFATQTVSITAATGDTVSNLAEKFVKAIESNAVLSAFGIFGTSVLGVVTLNHPGPVGNFTGSTESVSPGSETITLSAATLSGGTGAIIPYQGFTVSHRGLNVHFNTGEPRQVDILFLKDLVNSGSPIV